MIKLELISGERHCFNLDPQEKEHSLVDKFNNKKVSDTAVLELKKNSGPITIKAANIKSMEFSTAIHVVPEVIDPDEEKDDPVKKEDSFESVINSMDNNRKKMGEAFCQAVKSELGYIPKDKSIFQQSLKHAMDLTERDFIKFKMFVNLCVNGCR